MTEGETDFDERRQSVVNVTSRNYLFETAPKRTVTVKHLTGADAVGVAELGGRSVGTRSGFDRLSGARFFGGAVGSAC